MLIRNRSGARSEPQGDSPEKLGKQMAETFRNCFDQQALQAGDDNDRIALFGDFEFSFTRV